MKSLKLLTPGRACLLPACLLLAWTGCRPAAESYRVQAPQPRGGAPADVADEGSAGPNRPADTLVPPLEFDPAEGFTLVRAEHAPPADVDHGPADKSQLPKSQLPYLLKVEFDHDHSAHFHAHGEDICASGCAASRHPTGTLTLERYQQLLVDFAREPIDETSEAYEELLYFGRQTRRMMARYGTGNLDDVRVEALRRELARGHALYEMRVLDEHGELRSWLPPTRVPLDRRHVFDMHANNVQPLETSGTVKRVGLYHLWTRL